MGENTIALSQAEVDKLLKGAAPQPVKKTTSAETEAKIKKIKERAKAVAKKMKEDEKKAAKPAAKKSAKPAAKKPAKPAAKKPAKPAAKKPVTKLSVYFEGKLYGTAALSTKNGKKIVELLSIRKK